ncbi:MAG: chromate transporter [Fervidobacterium sp.]
MVYLELFLTFLQIGAISFGGGYSILKAISHYVVDTNRWITLEEFNDIVAISQSTPGPIGINAATFVGYKVGGIVGSLLATFSVILIPVILSLGTYMIYKKHSDNKTLQTIILSLKPIILAMIASAALNFLKNAFGSLISIAITVVSVLLLLYTNIDVTILLFTAGLLGFFVFR